MINNQIDVIDLLTKLVSIASPSTHEARASAYLAGWMNAHGLKAYIDPVGNAVGIKGSGPQEILLLGHIDTFPGELPVRREGDLLYGRGSVDAKGPLCVFAAAAAQANVPEGWQVTVVGAVEEEYATSKGARYILAQRSPEPEENREWKIEGRRSKLEALSSTLHPPSSILHPPSSILDPPSFCIIGEPSNWDRVTLGYKGRLIMDVGLHVPFSHSAGEGPLPAEQAVDFWRRIEEFCAEFNRKQEAQSSFERLDPSLRHITTRDEGAFGTVEMSVGFRLPLGLPPAGLESQLQPLVKTLPVGTTAKIIFSGGEIAYRAAKSNALVRAFLAAIRAGGGEPRFVVKTGTADMNIVGPRWPQTPIVAYGPGDSRLDHTPDEHLDLNEYLQAVEVLVKVIEILAR